MIASVRESLSVSKIVSIDKCSSLERVLRVTAWISCFIRDLRFRIGGDRKVSSSGLGRGELLDAEKLWVKSAQIELRDQSNFQQLEKQLRLFEEEGILKCRGRLSESDLGEDTKYPIILPRDHRLTELIIRKCHDRTHHSVLRTGAPRGGGG